MVAGCHVPLAGMIVGFDGVWLVCRSCAMGGCVLWVRKRGGGGRRWGIMEVKMASLNLNVRHGTILHAIN
jgi:hypothetical protein